MQRTSFIVLCACALLSFSLAAQETIRFTDDFSGPLTGWSVTGGEWNVASGQLRGDFRSYCNNNRGWCPEGDILIADVHQPRTADWRMDVDFQFAANSSPDGASNYQGPKAMFALWTTYRAREVYSVGADSWDGGALNSATLAMKTFGPWNAVAARSVPLNWNPSVFNKATLSKNGNVFSFYLNDQLVGSTASSTLTGNPKLGLHVTGSCSFKNFKLTEIGAPVTYSISGTVRNAAGQPMSGVTVTAVPTGKTATSDGAGQYVIPALDDRTTYTVTPAYSNALGVWTFSQPLHIKTLYGANISGADFTARVPGSETETVRFTDDFSGTLAAWVDQGGGWSVTNGHLNGYYSVYCGNMLCSHTYLILADQYQPRTTDWRMEADFTYTSQLSFYQSEVNFARWWSDTAAEMHAIGWRGNNWNGASQAVASWMQQTFMPAWLVPYYREANTPAWDPRQWNRAKLEKRGTLFYYYLNDHLLGIETGSVLPDNAKVGFHIYGTTLLDNFKLTELGDSIPGPVMADISVTQQVGTPKVVPGSRIRLGLAVSNAGPGTALNVKVTETLPAGALSVIVTPAVQWTCSTASNVVTCSFASLRVGLAPPILVTYLPPPGSAGTSIQSIATVTSDMVDPSPGSNSNTAVVQVEGIVPTVPALQPGTLALLALLLAAIAWFTVKRQA